MALLYDWHLGPSFEALQPSAILRLAQASLEVERLELTSCHVAELIDCLRPGHLSLIVEHVMSLDIPVVGPKRLKLRHVLVLRRIRSTILGDKL